MDDEHGLFQERCLKEVNRNATCLICNEKVAVLKEYNIKRHYWTKHGEQYEKYEGDERATRATQLQRGFISQQVFFINLKRMLIPQVR